MKKSKSGFTVVEIMIVVIVIAILASIVIISYSQIQARSRDARRKTDISNLIKALELYYDDNGAYPTVTSSDGSPGASWYSSDVAGWSAFKTTMASTIDSFPVDPRNSVGDVTSSTSINNYAYYANTSNSCNASVGQMYIIVYRYETAPKESSIDGNCTSNNPGAAAFTAGASYYVSSKG